MGNEFRVTKIKVLLTTHRHGYFTEKDRAADSRPEGCQGHAAPRNKARCSRVKSANTMGSYFYADNGDIHGDFGICGDYSLIGIFRVITQHFLRMQKASRGKEPRFFVFLRGGRRKPRFQQRVDNAGFRGRIGSEREEKAKKLKKELRKVSH